MLRTHDPLLSRQFVLLLVRLLVLKIDLPDGILSVSLQTSIHLLQHAFTSSYAADLLLFLTSFHRSFLHNSDVNSAILSSLQVFLSSASFHSQTESLHPVVRMQLTKCFLLLHQEDSSLQQAQLAVQLLESLCAHADGPDAMLCSTVVFNTVWQFFDHRFSSLFFYF